MNNSSPMLSICIPTFNRADLLRSALWALVPQVKQAGDRVELIVSDNCSPDHTGEVVRWGQQFIPICYNRNSENLGATRNYFTLTNLLAKGEFCWILGDDDLVRENAIESVLDALQSHPEVDYFFVNHSYEPFSERKKSGTLETGADFPELRNVLCYEIDSHLVEHWEEIIKFSRVPALFTSVVSHVMRLSKWREGALVLDIGSRDSFVSLEDTFPHACIVARMMVGKPAVYLGYPHVIMFTGTQEWFGDWPTLLFVRVLELADLMENLGVERQLVDYYRNVLFRGCSQQFWELLTRPSQLGRKYFSLRKFVMRYWHYESVWAMLAIALRAHTLHRARD